MKLLVRTLMATVVLLLLVWFGYSRRFQIMAAIWHWKHGYSVVVGHYVTPAPKGWLVDVMDSGSVLLTNTRALPSGGKVFRPNPTILVSTLPKSSVDLNFWASSEEQRLKHNGVRIIEHRTLTF